VAQTQIFFITDEPEGQVTTTELTMIWFDSRTIQVYYYLLNTPAEHEQLSLAVSDT